jgi:hypothetical protein
VRYGKPDANQPEIIKALQDTGCDVDITTAVGNGFEDIAVGRNGVTILLEIKTATGKERPKQQERARSYKGCRAMVRTVEEAIEAVNKAVRGQM